ncbi:hypothetical protein CcI49_29965 [Frankia sp. CcI49]|uniref:hypothetical protein n=1 Tax=Frankia sp. CcI49 TaxID=1745382 RepID=UPI0009CC1F18|nr:hypothetical protein [Frankia sp. CcI49]ONH54594.1 hypothetical protein CcI49_29965 [Frankia sp. CcI49]
MPAFALAALAAGCSSSDDTSSTSPAGAAAGGAAQQAAAGPPSAVDLMTRAGCQGGIIEPQLYSREVGRCTLNGAELDVATFDSNELRDQWAQFARDLGTTVQLADRWAVSGMGAAGPEAFAAAAG